jgi:hypothetical protein
MTWGRFDGHTTMERDRELTFREKLLRDFPIEDPAAPGWYFRVREVTPGMWKIEGRDGLGREVSKTSRGNSPSALQSCVAAALKIERDS